jgi:hypothetical protein
LVYKTKPNVYAQKASGFLLKNLKKGKNYQIYTPLQHCFGQLHQKNGKNFKKKLPNFLVYKPKSNVYAQKASGFLLKN